MKVFKYTGAFWCFLVFQALFTIGGILGDQVTSGQPRHIDI